MVNRFFLVKFEGWRCMVLWERLRDYGSTPEREVRV